MRVSFNDSGLRRSCTICRPIRSYENASAEPRKHDLVSPESLKETLTLPAALLYLLPWALAHSEELKDLERACEIIDITISEHPRFSLFERSKMAVDQHRQVLEKFGRYPQRNKDFLRENTREETEWLNDKENLPIWAGGKLSFDKPII